MAPVLNVMRDLRTVGVSLLFLGCGSQELSGDAGSGAEGGDGGSGATTTGGAPGGGSGGAGVLSSEEALAMQQAEHGWGPAECPATPSGVEVGYDTGQQLAELEFLTCDGKRVSLTEVCGAKAAWIFVAHGW